VVSTFCVSFAAAFLVSFSLVRRQLPPRARPGVWPLVASLGAVVAVVCVIAAFDLFSWKSAAAGGGCGIGIVAGQWLGAVQASRRA
jgi:hypothetical protein